jgi:environmental stress-induced protein Ves
MDLGLNIVRRSSFKASAWKNGGGITHEAARVPAIGDRYRWRVSVAQIEQSGPFSDFTGYRRKMALLRGSGLELRFGDGQQLTLSRVGDLAEFDGAVPAQCNLMDGPCTDFNLMVANEATVTARVERLTGPIDVGASDIETTLIFSLESALELKRSSGESAHLGAWDLAILSGYYGRLIVPLIAVSATPLPVFFATISH